MFSLNVLVACEESQAVCLAFRELGHNAFSADLQSCSGGHPEYHITGDVLRLLPLSDPFDISFVTDDNNLHSVYSWDIIIAHPPCTFLSNAGACRLFKYFDDKKYINYERFISGLAARDFFLRLLDYPYCDYIAVENPVPSAFWHLPNYSQIIQPFQFGHPTSKRTCLWLKGLPNLSGTKLVQPTSQYVYTCRSSKKRSKTFPGIANAMAAQWSKFFYDHCCPF